jgi:hypothetical protein
MLSFVLLIGLFQLPAQGISPCQIAKSKIADRSAPMTAEQICRLEKRMSLLTDGMSWNTAMKTLGIARKRLLVTAHGAITYRYLGGGYALATPFASKETPMRVLLLDGKGRVVKDVQWQ